MATLATDVLARFAERAPQYDRENRFFAEDFQELRDSGYLTINVPKELGGAGMNLAEVCREQRRLAYHAAPTALAINMHLYWVGVAADLWRGGDRSLLSRLHLEQRQREPLALLGEHPCRGRQALPFCERPFECGHVLLGIPGLEPLQADALEARPPERRAQRLLYREALALGLQAPDLRS